MEPIESGWKKLWPAFAANFLYSLHYATILYVNSSFLGKFYSWQEIALLYAAGSIGSIILFFLVPTYLRRFGNRSLFTLSLSLEALATIGLALSAHPALAAIFFLLYAAVSPLVYYSLDLALESVTLNQKTGEVRGAYLTLADIADVLAPLIVAVSAFGETFAPVYTAAVVILLPLFFIAPSFPKETRAREARESMSLLDWWRASDVRKVTLARGLLELFYAVMVIFVPVYLNRYLGFSWAAVGTLFSIMLLAFVLFEWIVGELADRFWGESEMMTVGFFVMGASVIVMPFLPASFALWALVLFLSRVGATLTEMTCESYFWKQVSAEDVGFITMYRSIRPAATVIGAIVGASVLALLPFGFLYFVLAAFMLLGTSQSVFIRDTR